MTNYKSILIIGIIFLVCIQIYFIKVFGLHSTEIEKQICAVIMGTSLGLFVYSGNNIFLVGSIIAVCMFFYFWYYQYTLAIESDKNFKYALENGTFKAILLRDPNKEGSTCANGICSMTVNDFIKAYK